MAAASLPTIARSQACATSISSFVSFMENGAPNLFERGDERGEAVRNRSSSVEPRRPVFSNLLAAAGAAQIGIQTLAGVLGVGDAMRFELTGRELAGGVEQHAVPELRRNRHLLIVRRLSHALKQIAHRAVRAFMKQHLERRQPLEASLRR